MPRRRYTFYIEPDQADALKMINERDGILPSEQIRRALDDWIEKKGVKRGTTADRRRASTRKRS
jgi:hypothetical protein